MRESGDNDCQLEANARTFRDAGNVPSPAWEQKRVLLPCYTLKAYTLALVCANPKTRSVSVSRAGAQGTCAGWGSKETCIFALFCMPGSEWHRPALCLTSFHFILSEYYGIL